MDLLVTNARLIDGTGSSPRSPCSIRVRAGRIAEIGAGLRGTGERQIDIGGATLLPGLIDAGQDNIQPVQTSSRAMETARLKREFGRDIGLWGGGCDTQRILSTGTPEQVAEDVQERVRILAPGGGFVFQQIHNVMADVPPQNVVAMMEAVNNRYHRFSRGR